MEDAASAEIARSRAWQWIHHPGGVLEDGRRIDLDLVHTLPGEEQARIRGELGEPAYARATYPLVGELLDRVVAAEELEEFLTLVAYDYLN
jgi:malate synthase